MTLREQFDLKLELARAYEHEAERLMAQRDVLPTPEQARRYLTLSHEMLTQLERESGERSPDATAVAS
jgi:hypothetical protein